MLIDRIILWTCEIAQRLKRIENAVRDLPGAQPMLFVKNSVVLREITCVPWHEKLIEIISWIDNKYPGQVMFTSGWRPEPGIHGTKPLRAVDLRSRNFENPVQVAREINQVFDYGKLPFKVCVYHRTATCRSCGYRDDTNKFWGHEKDRVDNGIKVEDSCPKCGGKKLRDNQRHMHIQSRDSTKKRLQK